MMSHIAVVQTQFLNLAVLAAVCTKLGFGLDASPKPHRVYQTTAHGRAVTLPGWRFPVVISEDGKSTAFDNYSGSWGAIGELHRLKREYAAEVAAKELRAEGHAVTRKVLADGSIELVAESDDE